MIVVSPQPARRLSLHGSGNTLFGIYIVNLFLTVVTLGIYYFWGKTRIRQYLAGHVEFEGDRFAYHGTGKELFVGWLKALLVFFLPIFLLALIVGFWAQDNPLAQIILQILVYAAILVVIPLATVGSRRYRLNRLSWRGIRFSFRGRAKEFLRIFIPGVLLTGITFGFYLPFFWVNTRRFLVNNAYFGTVRFEFDGKGEDLFGRYIRAILLSIVTLGIYSFWFFAEQQRYYWAHTSFATARFRSTVTGGPLFRLSVGNFLLLIFTLGLAWPWVLLRSLRFAFANLSLEGELDTSTIVQDAQAAGVTGEGLAEFLDLDFFDFDLGV